MKLYYSPGACSLASHIALREAGILFDLDKVESATKQTSAGENFITINPKGYVPALRLDDGSVLTEGAAILQFLADCKPDSGLAPKAGTMERYRLMEWLTFISSEVHKAFSPLFNAKNTDEVKAGWKAALARRFDYIESAIGSKSFLMGETFTVADAYLFTVLNWAAFLHLDLTPWPALRAYMARVASRPHVVEALKAEALVK